MAVSKVSQVTAYIFVLQEKDLKLCYDSIINSKYTLSLT